jgi:hypothetical protein
MELVRYGGNNGVNIPLRQEIFVAAEYLRYPEMCGDEPGGFASGIGNADDLALLREQVRDVSALAHAPGADDTDAK